LIEVVFVMLFVTESLVCGEHGAPEIYLLPEHMKRIAEDKEARKAVLESLSKSSLLVAGTKETSDVEIEVTDELDGGSDLNFHSTV
jgi:hypothetical protein